MSMNAMRFMFGLIFISSGGLVLWLCATIAAIKNHPQSLVDHMVELRDAAQFDGALAVGVVVGVVGVAAGCGLVICGLVGALSKIPQSGGAT
jgi:hypothetical protein